MATGPAQCQNVSESVGEGKKIMTKQLRIVPVLLILVLAFDGPVATSQTPDIDTGTATGAQEIRLALPDFPLQNIASDGVANASALAETFNDVLWNDLEFAGIFAMVGKSFYPSEFDGTTFDVDTAEWTDPAVGAHVMTFGHAEIDSSNRFYVEAHLWDLQVPADARELLGQSGLAFRIEASERGVRTLAHQIADRIVLQLGGGIRGIAQTKIVFASDRNSVGDGYPQKEIFVMDYDGYNQQQVTTLRSTALTPRWSHDNSRIAFTHMRDDGVDIEVISPVDRQGFAFPRFSGTTTTPAWAPGGRRIVFASSHAMLNGEPDMELYISDANGDNVRRLTVSRGTDISPVWNPVTGAQIAFVSDRLGTPQIFVMDVEGGNLIQISEGGHADEPAWSPDARLIAYAWQPPGGGQSDIYLYDFQTGRNVQLTESDGFNERPSWSPDGRHLVFQSDRNGSMQIYTMLANGSRVRRLSSQGNNESPAWSNYMAQ